MGQNHNQSMLCELLKVLLNFQICHLIYVHLDLSSFSNAFRYHWDHAIYTFPVLAKDVGHWQIDDVVAK